MRRRGSCVHSRECSSPLREGLFLRRVLFLAYHFPPIGGAGVQRSTKFARYLREFGYDPVVVTGPGASGVRWTPEDASLSSDVPADLEIRRLPGAGPAGSAALRRKLERWGNLRTPFERWWVRGAVQAGMDTGGDVAVVYASMSPFETADAAAILGAELGIPWVADLRDPWALDEMTAYPTRAHRAAARRRMRRALSSAAAIVMNTPEATRAAADAFPELSGRLTDPVPNGYDAADFAGPVPIRTDSRFRIVHTGYLHTELGLRQRRAGRVRRLVGGTTTGVDFLTRSHVYLLDAVGALLARRPELLARVEIVLAGVLSRDDEEVVGRFCHSELIRMPGYLPHHDTVELIRTADLLFLPMHDLPPGRRARIVPGKTYEYVASGRPILAAVPEGDARDLLGGFSQVILCAPSDVEAIADAIETSLEQPSAGRDRHSGLPRGITPYERRRQTASLARVFDDAVMRS